MASACAQVQVQGRGSRIGLAGRQGSLGAAVMRSPALKGDEMYPNE
ncbi:hypothetical protein FOPG_14152 [Fusarium oxysporum f. sp. conglutinans race 2 54008]|uniref:Uncharacterized protein n=1 Tax=Fusarium oxysporum f. sp. conglutinans race 2 54008 TaxID=1089457 RepID=X0HDR1_FUSOX|nr:hypothetical protein FOPG_14152 [Fusarium oxysporum f. sp. conglutinans race 2 54008]